MDLCATLTNAGATVLGPARRLGDAQQLAASQALDIALLDLDLAGETSVGLAESLLSRGVPVILTTGYEAADVKDRLKGAEFCQKPVSPPALIRMICDIVSRHNEADISRIP